MICLEFLPLLPSIRGWQTFSVYRADNKYLKVLGHKVSVATT